MKKTYSFYRIALSISAILAVGLFLPFKVQAQISTPQQIAELVSNATEISYIAANEPVVIKHEGATHLKLNIAVMDIAPGDTVTVSSGDGAQKYTYPGDASTVDAKYSGFWPLTIFGSSAIVTLNAKNPEASAKKFEGIKIPRYWRGYTDAEIDVINAPSEPTESICGSDDKQDAVCFANQFPTEFDKANAVARISFRGSVCTAWRVGPNANTVITNNHCVDDQAGVNTSELWFGYQNTECNGGSTTANRVIVTGSQFLVTDFTMDLTLLTINNPSSVAQFGALTIDNRQASNGETIYIPQHPGGRPKELSIFDSQQGGARCSVQDNSDTGRAANSDIAYTCDTEGGSSGSPVLSTNNHQVVALHHFGGCTNSGARADLFWPIVEPFLDNAPPPPPAECVEGAIDLSNTVAYASNNTGSFNVSSDGCSITLNDNIWRQTTQTFEITANSVLNFSFSSNGTGEIQGVGLDENTGASTDRIFKLAGNQNWGIQDFTYTGNGATQDFSIPVGEFYTGTMALTFANDNDSGSGNTITVSNVVLSGVGTPPPSPPPLPPPSNGAPFGINSSGVLYHENNNWTAGFVFLCLNGDCRTPTLNGGRYERPVDVVDGETYTIEFKVQDNTVGQCLSGVQTITYLNAGISAPTNCD